ncbi:hypothetical protein FisN_17Lh256 [Fistulifera solaris]|uniref:F-box domain-containing protein n=1 Tax=Fistulifera solaris TaxID=1519565 RepID=A0A1Z5KMY6_FISSO|nr:hypothetical protein FisN_17Lh256 [Fistulifera solaris]|eukprot:GAX27361.1 hypothetical protein FisN_17Lh256 [Fistulifera solaris]
MAQNTMESDSEQERRNRTQLSAHLLSSLLTNHTFDEIPLVAFQSEVCKTLSQIVVACTTTPSLNGVQSISFARLDECLQRVDWKTIIEQRDARLRPHKQSTMNLTTPCDVLLSSLKDTTVWPPACNGCLVKVLLNHLLFHRSGNSIIKRSTRCGRLDWSPSHSNLLDFVIEMMQVQPSLDANQVTSWIRSNLNESNKTDTETINVAISIVKELIRSFPFKAIVFLPLFLDMLCVTEALLNKLRSALPRVSNSEIGKPQVKRSRLVHGTNVAVLHGESSDCEEDAYHNRLFVQHSNAHKNSQSLGADRKKILQANTQSSTRTVTYEQIAFLSALRTKCLKAFLASSNDCASTSGVGAVNQSLFRIIFNLLESQPGSETILVRFAALLLINANPPLAYQKLLDMLWSRVDEANDPCACLSFYVELLIESSIFDDRTALTTAIQPLLDLVKRRILNREDQALWPNAQVALHCLACLLTYRGTMLMQLPEFLFLLAQLSNEYPSPKQWLLVNTVSAPEELKLLTSLRESGVFGIENELEEDGILKDCSGSWFYDPHRSSTIRTCSLFTGLASSGLSSPWSPTNSDPKLSCGSQVDQPLHPDTKGGIALHDLGDDVLREVFSFLGFKRIVFNRQVCKRWKCIGDDEFNTWKPLYVGRFGVDLEDPLLSSAACTLSWKQLFMERWMAEKEIRYKRDKNGWRWRLCTRIGCLTVHSSPSRLLKHQSTHKITSKERKRARRLDATPTKSVA